MKFSRALTIFTILALGLIVFGYYRDLRNYASFNALAFNGTLAELHSSSGGLRIKLENSDQLLQLFLEPNIDAGEIFFDRLAQKGDFVKKQSLSDTLFLIKDDKNYHFLVAKPSFSVFGITFK